MAHNEVGPLPVKELVKLAICSVVEGVYSLPEMFALRIGEQVL